MARDLCARLAAEGHEVTVITQFPNRPLGRIFDGYRRSLRMVEHMEAVNVVRCPNWFLDRKRRWWNRVLENVTFGLSSLVNIVRSGRPDIVVLETWPFVATDLVLRLCRHWQTPVLHYVKDCYPEALEYTGHIRTGGRLANLLRGWDRNICKRCAEVIVISEGMKELLCRTRDVAGDKVTVIADWIDSRNFPTLPRDNDWRREAGISTGQFLVLFAGTLGHVSGAEVLVDVCRNLAGHPAVSVVCVGEGVLKQEMQQLTAAAGLKNLRFLPFQPSERVAEMHAAADATVLTTQANFPDASVPSKLITYLAAGRPVLCAADSASTVAKIVQEAGAGVLAEPGNARSVSEAISFLAGHPAECKEMGENARRYFEKHFTLERACEQFLGLIRQMDGAAMDSYA